MQRITHHQPHPLFGVAGSRWIEQTAAASLPAHTLMQRAGLAVARLALALAPHARTVWLACGPGNNGGDGLEAALHLARWGRNPVVSWLGSEATMPADAAASLRRARDGGVRFADAMPESMGTDDLCIDALLGIGNTRAPAGRMRDWMAAMHRSPATVLATDLPSGLHADTGTLAAPDSAVRAHHTLSLLTLKPGLFTAQGRDHAGQVWFDDLGCGSAHLAQANGYPGPVAWLAGAPANPARAHASHKGSYGDVAVIGGAPGMTGAALLAARAALCHGAGRVFVALLGGGAAQDRGGPQAMQVDIAYPELMFRMPGALALESMTVVCGCGGGDAVGAALPEVLGRAARLVLDADALNAIAQDAALQAALRARADRRQSTVLTPHPLEAARWLNCSTGDVQADRLGMAQRLADSGDCVAVLKGSGTIVAAPQRVCAINPTGNARLATAGTGDVLAGMVGAALAGGEAAFEAACAAVYRHGNLADRWPADRPLTAAALASAGRAAGPAPG